jgi:hypothetical protein
MAETGPRESDSVRVEDELHDGHVSIVRVRVTRGQEHAIGEATVDASDGSEIGQRVLAMEASGHPMARLWRNRLERLRADLPRRARQRAGFAAAAKLEGR